MDEKVWPHGRGRLGTVSAVRRPQPVRGGPPRPVSLRRRVRLQELPEASGLAASRRTPGLLWSHNDSGEPVVFALNATGAVKDRVRVTGAQVEDWEAIAVGSCPQGSCL